jgi:hypothetical protein
VPLPGLREIQIVDSDFRLDDSTFIANEADSTFAWEAVTPEVESCLLKVKQKIKIPSN